MGEAPPRARPAGELERLWAGAFGDAYVDRNRVEVAERARFWAGVLERFGASRVLEIGPAHGENLRHLAGLVPAGHLVGLDVNDRALAAMRAAVPGAQPVRGVARRLPFPDRAFDLVFTVGLLIHVPDEALRPVMGEIVRCSARWVLCGEYHADAPTDVNYRGEPGVLLKRDYGAIYARMFPELALREEGFLTRADGFDRVTYQVFERPA